MIAFLQIMCYFKHRMSREHSLYTLPTPELREAAEAEAREFGLPSDWREGRPERHGYAIDHAYSKDKDDAVSASSNGGDHILHVSIVNTGDFLVDQPAIRLLAQRALVTTYRGNVATLPMIPREISEDALSLNHQAERPVVTVDIPVDNRGNMGDATVRREIIRADSLSPDDIGSLPELEDDDHPLHRLKHLAYLLYAGRHRDSTNVRLEDEDGHSSKLKAEANLGRFIVSQSMIAANIAMGKFFADNEIPAIFRQHGVPVETQLQLGGRHMPRGLEVHFARASYTTERMSRHLGLHAMNVAHFTSPLRRLVDFANHANLAAFQDDEEPRYKPGRLEIIAARHVKRRPSAEIKIPRKFKGEYAFEEAVREFRNNTAKQNDYASIFFGPHPDDDDVAELQREVFGSILGKKGLARDAIQVAIHKGWHRLEVRDDGAQYLVDTNGNEIPYTVSETDGPSATRYKSLVALSHRIGTPIEYQEIVDMTRRAEILANGRNFIEQLSRRLRTPLQESSIANEEATEFTHTVSMKIRGETHTHTATADSAEEARRQAIGVFISELDLIDNPPSPPPSMRSADQTMRKKAQQLRQAVEKSGGKKHPFSLINNHANKRGAAVDYIFSQSDDNTIPQFTCDARITYTDEKTLQATATCGSKNDAKLIAAADLAKQIGLG